MAPRASTGTDGENERRNVGTIRQEYARALRTVESGLPEARYKPRERCCGVRGRLVPSGAWWVDGRAMRLQLNPIRSWRLDPRVGKTGN